MCSRDLPVQLEAICILTCVSLMQPLTKAVSFFASLVVGKKTRVVAGQVAPKIWEPSLRPKMQLEQNIKKFRGQQLRKHVFNIPKDLRREAIDVTDA